MLDNTVQGALIATLALTGFGCRTTPESDPTREPSEPRSALQQPRENQRQHQVSPSGKYVLSVPTTLQVEALEPVHVVTIKSSDGALLYEDEDSRLFAGLNVYFGWDEVDRVWLYNSDDGSVWRWELEDGHWQKSRTFETTDVPRWILPDYAKTEN